MKEVLRCCGGELTSSVLYVLFPDTSGAGAVSEASPSKDKVEFRDDLNSSHVSESSLSSLSLAGSYRSDMPEASKSGPVDVIRSRRSGLGRKTVRKQVRTPTTAHNVQSCL